MRDIDKRGSHSTLFTRNASAYSLKFVGVLLVIAAVALIAIVPFAIAVVSAMAPVTHFSTIQGIRTDTKGAAPDSAATPGER